MGLNERERRKLTAIEAQLERDNIQLAYHLRSLTPPRRRQPRLYPLVLGLVVLLLLVAAAAAAPGGRPGTHREYPTPAAPISSYATSQAWTAYAGTRVCPSVDTSRPLGWTATLCAMD